jgi:hypothetical protein
MQIPTTLSAMGAPASAAFGLLGKIAQAAQPLLSPVAPSVIDAAGTLTPERVRAALLEMGVAAADADVALAEALVQAGLPLTAASVAEAHGDLARSPGASPQAYVLAKTLALPTSPDALRALTAVLGASDNQAGRGALPEQVRMWLGLGVEAGTAPEAQARRLREMVLQVGRSTEHRLMAAAEDRAQALPIADLRTALLRLAQSSGDHALRAEADGVASLLEGQQLLNQASLTAHAGRPDLPLYFALPLAFDGLPTIAETRVWLPGRETDGEAEDEPVLRVTLRLTPPRLGRVQADLTGRLAGSLSCRLGAEKASAARLLGRHADLLVDAFSRAGWSSCDVVCRAQAEWPPLWPGGEAFTTPRAYIDQLV